jgi:hypothetical protein
MLRNLLIGLPTMLVCLTLQAVFTFWSVRYYMGQTSQMPKRGSGLIAHTRPLLIAMVILILGNLLQIVIWGVLFVLLGEFGELYESIYHSAVNFSSLGYGDVVMSQRWKLLGPLEAGNGVLMFAMTSAALMTMLQQLIKAHFARQPG